MLYRNTYESPLGILTMTSDGDSLTGLFFDRQRHFEALPEAEEKNLPVFTQTGEWLDIYFTGRDPGPLPPLRPEGTPFRREVWSLLLEIPYGCTVTYGQLAQRVAALRDERSQTHTDSDPSRSQTFRASQDKKRMSSRAVGGAVGHNPISILVPCHRIIGSNGSLTGYGGGLERKIYLLKLEGVEGFR